MSVARWVLVLVMAGLTSGSVAARADRIQVQVYKESTCGCCVKWIAHLQEYGFQVTTTELPDVAPIKAKHKVPKAAQSCHTALVNGYVVEGHVPAMDLLRFLREKPVKVLGLAVPGMPRGSPGMEAPSPEPYDVVTFDAAGALKVYASHKP